MTLKSISDLSDLGLLPADPTPELEAVAASFAVAITPHLEQLIVRNPDGPVARQFIPDRAESIIGNDETVDPIGDGAHTVAPGVVHRYDDRVLMLVSGVCAAYCRFCFRRDAIGPPHRTMTRDELAAAIRYVEEHDQVWEVILSGGDPLLLPPRLLAFVAERISAMPHVGVMRVHTRLPIVKPSAVDDAMIAALKRKTATYVVLHVNHVDELSPEVRAAIARLADAGVPLLSQTVLLRDINDSAAVLRDLFRALLTLRVKPYYLHALDRARGTSHFAVPIEEGQAIMRELKRSASGLCQPQFVLDIPGGHGKVPIGPQYAERQAAGYRVTDLNGQTYEYPD